VRRFAFVPGILATAAVLVSCASSRHPAAATPTHNVLVYSTRAGIWVAAPNGIHARLLTTGDNPSVSPDGRYVAFVTDGSPHEKVRVMPTGGGPAKTVGAGAAGLLRWAPNSRYLGFTDFDRNRTLVVDVESGRRLRTLPSSDFAFSPDSQHVAYSYGGVWVVPTRGGTPVRLTNGLTDSNPVWGKPGIAYFGHAPNGDVWLMSPHGDDARQLTHAHLGRLPFAFSADGTKLLAYVDASDPVNHNVGRLWAVDIPSGRTRALTGWSNILPVGLSTSGTRVLAISGAGCTLETIPFAGGKPHVIVHGACSASWNAR
jgi:Tol biopolymer transport system component